MRGEGVNKKYSEEWFRSTDLWVMSPARYHCATPLTNGNLLPFRLLIFLALCSHIRHSHLLAAFIGHFLGRKSNFHYFQETEADFDNVRFS